MKLLHDIEGQLQLLHTEGGGKQTAALSGDPPTHRLYDNYYTTGFYEYPDTGPISPGETTRALVWLITPEVYPSSVWVGKHLRCGKERAKLEDLQSQEFSIELSLETRRPIHSFGPLLRDCSMLGGDG